MAGMTKDKDATTSLYGQAGDVILADILEGRLAPGDPVDRRAYAARLGISLAPVHMAVNQLEAEGFVVTLPRRGTHVRGYRAEDLRGHQIVRAALESEAARYYAGDKIKRRRDTLRVMARKIHDVHSVPLDRMRADVAFHQVLVETAGVGLLSEEFGRVMRVGLFLAVCLVADRDAPAGDDHESLIDDLCAASPETAPARIRHHIEAKVRALT